MRTLTALFLCLSCLFLVTPINANETDQYDLPPKPLADIAPEVEAYVVQHIQTAIDKLNADIAKHEACVSTPDRVSSPARVSSPHVSKGSTSPPDTAVTDPQHDARPAHCGTERQELSALEKLRSPDAVARAVYDQLGAGDIFISGIGHWLLKHKFEAQPSSYVTTYGESIYVSAPVDYATISPTIRVYGVEFGTDKFDHIFQQGYTYYRKYNAARKAGKTDAEALKSAVAYGRFTENTFFGYTVSGVYSNADLAANIAGLKFYQNLANDVLLGTTTRPAVVKWSNDHWQFNPWTGMCSKSFEGECAGEGEPSTVKLLPTAPPVRFEVFESELRKSPTPSPAKPDASSGGITSKTPDSKTPDSGLLRPFITPHLNEALNPSNYLFFLYPVVKSVVQKRACPEWRAAFPDLTRDELTRRTAALTTWNGLDYGYKQTSRQVRLANVCFPETKGPASEK